MDVNTLNEALVALFPQPGQQEDDPHPLDEVLGELRQLQQTGLDSSFTTYFSGRSLEPLHYASIAFLDKYLTSIIDEGRFPEEVDLELRKCAASIFYAGLAEGLLGMTRGPLVHILDHLIAVAVGYEDTKGKARDVLRQRLEDAVIGISIAMSHERPGETIQRARDNLLNMLAEDIGEFVEGEAERVSRLEQRMIDAESGQLAASRSRQLAAQVLNEKMHGKVIPEKLLRFLHGAWYDSMHLIASREGTNSDAWRQGVQLTETLIKTVQPAEGKAAEENTLTGDDLVAVDEPAAPKVDPAPDDAASKGRQQLYRIIEELPGELKKLLVSVEHDRAALEASMRDIESVHVDVMRGKHPPGVDFELLASGDDAEEPKTRVSQSLISTVNRLSPGHWFVYQEENAPPRHIKLMLKSDDTQQLLFSNRNGLKVLNTTYEEFAYLLSSSAVVPMPEHGQLLKSLRFKLMATMKEKVKKDLAEEQKQKRLAAERHRKALDDVGFLVIAVNKNNPGSDTQLSLNEMLETLKGNPDKVTLIDRTDLSLDDMSLTEIARAALGEATEVTDEAPEGMAEFRAAVLKMRKGPKLEATDDS